MYAVGRARRFRPVRVISHLGRLIRDITLVVATLALVTFGLIEVSTWSFGSAAPSVAEPSSARSLPSAEPSRAGPATPTAMPANCRPVASRSAIPWKILVLIYPSADFTYQDAAGVSRSFQSKMTKDEIAQIRAGAKKMPATVRAYSDGYTSATVTVALALHPLGRVEPNGSPGNVTVAAKDLWADLDTLAPDGTDDSIIVFWKPFNAKLNLNLPYAGNASWLGAWTGVTYATALVPEVDPTAQNPTVPIGWEPVLIMLHEWLHGVVFYYGLWGYDGPDPDTIKQGDDGYRDDNDASQYLSDLMRGDVHNSKGPLGGITKAIWRSGTPLTRPMSCGGQ